MNTIYSNERVNINENEIIIKGKAYLPEDFYSYSVEEHSFWFIGFVEIVVFLILNQLSYYLLFITAFSLSTKYYLFFDSPLTFPKIIAFLLIFGLSIYLSLKAYIWSIKTIGKKISRFQPCYNIYLRTNFLQKEKPSNKRYIQPKRILIGNFDENECASLMTILNSLLRKRV